MKLDRKAAVAAYKERKAIPGIYAVRCAATGQAWVGQTPDLTTVRNRIWFSLRQDCSRNPQPAERVECARRRRFCARGARAAG